MSQHDQLVCTKPTLSWKPKNPSEVVRDCEQAHLWKMFLTVAPIGILGEGEKIGVAGVGSWGQAHLCLRWIKERKRKTFFWNYRVSETTCILPVYHPKWSLTSCLVGKLALTRLMAMLATRQLLTGLIFILRHCATTRQLLQNNDYCVVRTLCCFVTLFPWQSKL